MKYFYKGVVLSTVSGRSAGFCILSAQEGNPRSGQQPVSAGTDRPVSPSDRRALRAPPGAAAPREFTATPRDRRWNRHRGSAGWEFTPEGSLGWEFTPRDRRLPERQGGHPSTAEVCRRNSKLQLQGLRCKLLHGDSSPAGNKKRWSSGFSLSRGVSRAFQLKEPKHHFVKVKSQKAEALCSGVSLAELPCAAHAVPRRHERVQTLSAAEPCLTSVSGEVETSNDYQPPWFLLFLAYWTAQRAVVLK